MKISIITACYNSELTIESTIQSVLEQDCSSIEYIIIDGNSTDKTLSIIEKYKSKIDLVISENDKGIYDALNKGIKNSSGDIIGFLHADDFFKSNNTLTNVLNSFSDDIDMVYGDVEYVSKENLSKVTRYWKSGNYKPGIFKWGWMPPHTGFFLKKSCYYKYGLYSLELGTSADYELMLRMFELHRLSHFYLPQIITCMRLGGVSNRTLKNRWLANRNDKKSWELNCIKPYWFTFLLKPIRKVFQFV